jgi:hypothetical protein
MPHPGLVEIFISHRKFVTFFYHTKCRTSPNITLCNCLLKYHFLVEALVKYTYFVFKSVIITHLVFFTIYFITRTHHWKSKYHTFCLTVSQLFMYHTQWPLQSLSVSVVPDQNLAISCVFTCIHCLSHLLLLSTSKYHTLPPLPPLRVHLIPRTLSIVMPLPKRHTTMGATRKVAPTRSPPPAPDVA